MLTLRRISMLACMRVHISIMLLNERAKLKPWAPYGCTLPQKHIWRLFCQSHSIIYNNKNPFSHLIGWQTKGCFAVPLHIVEKSRWMGCYEATVLKNRRKRTRTRMHTIMYLMVMKALWILSRTAAQQWAMCSSHLSPQCGSVCVCVSVSAWPHHTWLSSS